MPPPRRAPPVRAAVAAGAGADVARPGSKRAQRAGEAEAEVRPQRRVAARCGRGTSSRSRPRSRPCPPSALDRRRSSASCGLGVTSSADARRARMCASACEHVVGLRLGHVDDRVVAEAGVRPEQEEEVREAGDRRAAVGLRAAVPVLGQRAALAAADPLGDRHVGDVEAGAEDDRVDLALGAVGADDRALADLGDAVGDDLDVRLAERRAGSRWREDPLAARQRSPASASRAARGSRDLARAGAPCRRACRSGASATRSIGIANASRAQ